MSMSTGISRRSLLKGAALSAAGVAALGVMGCSPQASGASDDAAASGAATEGAKHTWEVKPDPIAADKIKETVDTDVLVIGGGYSGTCCALSAAENGAKVILVEKDAMLNGHGVGGTGAIGSRELDKLDISFDKSIEMERWVSTCGNRCRESLVAKWFRESERCMNWFLDLAESNGATCMVTVGSRSTVHPEIDCYHMIMGGDIFEQHTMADFVEYLFESEALKNGAQFVYEMPAVQLVQDDSVKVTGAVCENKDGEYVQYNASKGVVLCTGDIGGDLEMCKAYAPICAEYGQPRSQYTPVGVNTGDGHKMGMWVGAQLQDLPLPTMMHPQAFCWFHGPFLFVNDNGERFMCEDTWVQGKSLAINRQPNGEAWSIFDANWKTDLVNGLPYGGGMFWDSFRPYGSDLELAPQYFETQIPEYIKAGNAYQADTLDELAKQIGCDAATFKATVERYNGMCEAGEDTDYYKKPVFLTPVKEGPFYALKVGPALLAVPGGLRTNNDFQCLDAEGAPIEGLYALGNVMGDICAVDYPINVAGNSHGRCITYGYLLGHELAGA